MTKEILKDDIIINEIPEDDLPSKTEETSDLVDKMPESNEVIDPSVVEEKSKLFKTKEEMEEEIKKSIYPKNHVMRDYPNQRFLAELKSKFKIILKDLTD